MPAEKTEEKKVYMPEPGKPLPKGFDNPPPGDPGHRCIDLQGKYRPDWVCIRIEKTPQVQDRLPFMVKESEDPKAVPQTYQVKTGMWVDVPKCLYEGAASLKYQKIETNFHSTDPLTKEGFEQVVEEKPALFVSALPSA